MKDTKATVEVLLDEYFIEGAWNTDNEYPGGSYVTVKIKPYQIPLFIRKGSSLKLGDLNELYQESFLIASKKGNLTELEASEDW